MHLMHRKKKQVQNLDLGKNGPNNIETLKTRAGP